MSLTLNVDGPRWREHLRRTAAAHPGLVPVVKGNGYGFTLGRLARRTQWLAEQDLGHEPDAGTCDTLAVGMYDELEEVVQRFDGSVVVLTPWRPFGSALEATADDSLADRLVHTVGRLEDLEDLLARRPRARFVLERLTSMQRHGLSARELWAVGEALRAHPGARLEGVAMHFPLAQGSHTSEASRLLTDVVGAQLPPGPRSHTVWVSHLSDTELSGLRARWPDFTFRSRMGTGLWLGDRGSLSVTSTVLDVHPLERGDVFGYRGRTAPKSGHLLVVTGGTAHGVGLEAPTGDLGLRGRAATLARGGLDAVGFVRSPFSIDGKQRLFAEPPHMQASMLFVPTGARVPAVGDVVDVRVRYTATAFDRIVVS
ncbi:Alanine racemase [Nocardioides dokdonensis FR1436]|uniref:Alanine racemase n=1 Tax=Nocardioides dokdonensis FR1436 TaxID=1300347 RepID=A0A1A9GH92_9ACTN|nr:alanine racemase [Nocardioides dokdonensis]ANH37689.1 Alanine racemase [Nocardioides dokdonensis FR1436]